MRIPNRVRLVGGPCHGDNVRFLGMNYQRNVPRKFGGRHWYMAATYEWRRGDEPDTIVGVFVGYFSAKQRLDSLGRKIKR